MLFFSTKKLTAGCLFSLTSSRLSVFMAFFTDHIFKATLWGASRVFSQDSQCFLKPKNKYTPLLPTLASLFGVVSPTKMRCCPAPGQGIAKITPHQKCQQTGKKSSIGNQDKRKLTLRVLITQESSLFTFLGARRNLTEKIKNYFVDLNNLAMTPGPSKSVTRCL